MILRDMRPNDKVTISAEVVAQTAHGTTMLTDGERRWEMTNGWSCTVDPEYHVTPEEKDIARENYEGMCEALGLNYAQLELSACRGFRRSLTNGKGFRVYIAKIVKTAAQSVKRRSVVL